MQRLLYCFKNIGFFYKYKYKEKKNKITIVLNDYFYYLSTKSELRIEEKTLFVHLSDSRLSTFCFYPQIPFYKTLFTLLGLKNKLKINVEFNNINCTVGKVNHNAKLVIP